jgi:purine-binding chemotaxis protein CheW
MGEMITQLAVSEVAPEPEAGAEASQYLTFFVGKERFAIGILDVQEIIEINAITQVPMTPDLIRGVINLRGSVVAVVDLAARLGRESSTLSKRSSIILVEINHDGKSQTIGMLVDMVNEILEIPQEHILPPPNFGSTVETKFIQAMGQVDDQFIILLDINYVLTLEELENIHKLAKLDLNTITPPGGLTEETAARSGQ